MDELNEHERQAIDDEIAASLDALRRGESVVEALVDMGSISHAALYAQVVAYRAWLSHTGVFASPAIEAALARAATRIETPVGEEPQQATNLRRVLHIASAVAYPEGGHGRLVDRWIRSDTSSTHSLAITRPGHDAAQFLRDTVDASGGKVRLAPGTSSFVERARDLRQFASQFDAVVLHAHPHDPIPILALAWPGRPPTILCNHAPQVFWLGGPIADVVTYGREYSKTISVERRGILPETCFGLQVPVDPPRETTPEARDAIRAELGVAPNDLFLLTVASEYKFRHAGSRDSRRMGKLDRRRHPAVRGRENARGLARRPLPRSKETRAIRQESGGDDLRVSDRPRMGGETERHLRIRRAAETAA